MSALPLPPGQQSGDLAGLLRFNRDRRRQLKQLSRLERAGLDGWRGRIGLERSNDQPDRVRLALRTIGFLDRAPFVEAIKQWALTLAAAGRNDHRDGASELIRENDKDHDAFVAAVRAAAEALAKDETALGRRSAATLLRLTGLPQDADRAVAIAREPVEPVHYLGVADDGEVGLTREVSEKDIGHVLLELSKLTGRPDTRLSSALSIYLESTFDTPLQETLATGNPNDELLMPSLARWMRIDAITGLQTYLRSTPDLGPAASSHRSNYRRVARVSLPVASELDRGVVAGIVGRITGHDGMHRRELNFFRMLDLDFCDQVDLLLAQEIDHWSDDVGTLMNAPETAAMNALLERVDLRRTDKAGMRAGTLAIEILGSGFEPTVPLDWRAGFSHAELGPRRIAARLAARIGGREAAEQILRLGWSAAAEPAEDVAFYVSEALLALDDATLEGSLDRLDSENLLRVYELRASLRSRCGDLLLEKLHARLLTPRRSHAFGAETVTYVSRRDFLKTLYADRGEAIAKLIREAWSRDDCRNNVRYHDLPDIIWPLLAEMAHSDPEFVAEVWRAALRPTVPMRDSSIELFPAELPAGAVADQMRREMLDRPGNDDELGEAVFRLQANHEPFVLSEIARRLRQPRAVDRARAITMAGFLYATSEATALWQSALADPPGRGWLAAVHRQAAAAFEEAQQMRHWAAELYGTPDEIAAWRAFWVLGRLSDRRMKRALTESAALSEPRSWRRCWVHLQRGVWNRISEDRQKQRQSRRFFGARMDYVWKP